MNKVILLGRLTRDPEIKQTPSGAQVCRISIAINRKYKNKQTGELVDDSTFVDCDAWNQGAEFIGRYFRKGDMICIEGMLKNNNYEDANGVKHYGMKVMIDHAYFTGSKQESGGSQQTNQGAPQTYQQQPAHGGYNAPYAPQAPQQGQTYQQQPMPPQNAQRAPQQAAPQNLGNLEQFVDILSEGELPF